MDSDLELRALVDGKEVNREEQIEGPSGQVFLDQIAVAEGMQMDKKSSLTCRMNHEEDKWN